MTTATLPSTAPAALETTRPARRRWLRAAVIAGVGAALLSYVVAAGSDMETALAAVRTTSPTWLLLGLLSTVASMIAFSITRTSTLRAAGHPVQLRKACALSYAAGALHTTLPGGTVFSTGYAFRQLRRWGTPSAIAAWSMTISGLLSTLTLAAIALTGLLLANTGGGLSTGTMTGVAVAIIAAIALRRALRNPDALWNLLQRLLIRFNRLRHVPAETGLAALRTTVDDMRTVRPSRRSWIAPVISATSNWLLDLACLACAAAASGVHVSLPALIVTYVAGMTTASALPLPGGVGGVEAAMVVGLTVAGAASAPALAAVLLYRLMSTGSVVIVGWIVVAAQRRYVTQQHQALPSRLAPQT